MKVQVWASKWNERAYFSTRKVKLDHDYLCMAVLVQEVVSADYAFVIHTTNPSSGDSSEIYTEVSSSFITHLLFFVQNRKETFALLMLVLFYVGCQGTWRNTCWGLPRQGLELHLQEG